MSQASSAKRSFTSVPPNLCSSGMFAATAFVGAASFGGAPRLPLEQRRQRRDIPLPSEWSLFVCGIEPLGEAQTSGPILAAFEEIAGSHELAVGILASCLAGDRVVAFAGGECCDLSLTGHFQEVMIDDAFGDALAADQYPMIAQDQEGAALEIADQFRRHLMIEFEAFEFVIFHFAIKPQRMLLDRGFRCPSMALPVS